MAKVDTIELSVNGKVYSYNINVGKTGIFRCKLDWQVAKAIGIESSFEKKTLRELKSAILNPYNEYLDSKKTEEVLIAVRYQSNGKYAYYSDGRRMFCEGNRKYSSSRFVSDVDSLSFDFHVVIKQTSSTGCVVWYETQKGQGCVNYNEADQCDPNKYYKKRQTIREQGKLIPYSDQAMDTLIKARDGIQRISNILFGVVSKDDKELEALLKGGNLLKQ